MAVTIVDSCDLLLRLPQPPLSRRTGGMSFAARGRAFEKTVQRALERHGFSLRLTAAGPDGGIDLKGEWILGPSSHASSSTGLHASHDTQARRVSCAVQCKFQVCLQPRFYHVVHAAGNCLCALHVCAACVRCLCVCTACVRRSWWGRGWGILSPPFE